MYNNSDNQLFLDMEKKYKLIDETINVDGRTLYRIEALKDFGNVKKGEKGGFVEDENNLYQGGDCWIGGNAKVYDNATVYGNARVDDYAIVRNNAQVYGKARICRDAIITSDSDYIIFKNWWSSGRFFTWTRSNNMWKVGCFYGTGEQLINKAYGDSELSGREYERVVKYVESIIKDCPK